MFLLLPVITSLRGIDLMQLPGYLADGAHPLIFSFICDDVLRVSWAADTAPRPIVSPSVRTAGGCVYFLPEQSPECWPLKLSLVNPPCAGAKCFGGMTPSCGADCSGAPLLPIAYVAMNLLFNISALLVLRTSGEAT